MAIAKNEFMERLYLPEIAKACPDLTPFFRNMTLHTLHKLGLAKETTPWSPSATLKCAGPSPGGALAASSDQARGRLTQMRGLYDVRHGMPGGCIYIEAEEHPDPAIEKRPKHFDIDMSSGLLRLLRGGLP